MFRRSAAEEIKILNIPPITAEQIADSLLAIPAFIPATVCTGYVTAWFTNLHGFRQRSLIERIFWSVPLSLAVSTIAAVLIGKFLSLTAVAVFFGGCAVLWLFTLGQEWLRLRRSGTTWNIGWRPLGSAGLIWAVIWTATAVLSLVDIQRDHRLFMSIATFDQSARVNWTESILRTGVPPANPLYFYIHAASMRYYYFWNVICAAVARMAHLPVRAVFISSCVWAGFALAALIGLYLKHFFEVGARLRRQFLLSISLLMVTGLDICAHLWNLFYFHRAPPGDLEWWSADQITSWFDSLLWVPHHIASMTCCMFALLLAWMDGKDGRRRSIANVALIAAALASSFGLSVYVASAFFLVMLAWGFWHVIVERTSRPALLLAAGGVGAAVLLIPYLRELTHNSSGTRGGGGGAVFGFAVREMISPDGLLAARPFQQLAASHPFMAQNIAKLILLAPGYAMELGFYVAVFLVCVVPAWRGRTPLTPARRSLVFISAVTLVLISFVRSMVLGSNDFGWRAALLLQFPLLLLASDLLTGWKLGDSKLAVPADRAIMFPKTPKWLRSLASLALGIGLISTVCQALMLRFDLPLIEAVERASRVRTAADLSHNAYISAVGYGELDVAISRDSIVQYNPAPPNPFRSVADVIGIDHQSAIASDKPWCGSELGGDPSGCITMAAAIDSLYNGATAEQARATCHKMGIQYLVSRVYDPAWKDMSGWVWTLKPVVSDEEFRALDCWR